MDFLLSLLDKLLTLEAAAAIVIISYHGKPFANFILRMVGKKPMNGDTNNWLTIESYNNRRPDWFIEWEKRHDKTHDRIGTNIKEVGDEVKKVAEKLGDVSEAVARIDERTKNDKS